MGSTSEDVHGLIGRDSHGFCVVAPVVVAQVLGDAVIRLVSLRYAVVSTG